MKSKVVFFFAWLRLIRKPCGEVTSCCPSDFFFQKTSPKKKSLEEKVAFEVSKRQLTVDGRNPAPPGIYKAL